MSKTAMGEVSEAAQCFAKQRDSDIDLVTVMLGKETENGKRRITVNLGGMPSAKAARLMGAIHDAMTNGLVSPDGDFGHVDICGIDWGKESGRTIRVSPVGSV